MSLFLVLIILSFASPEGAFGACAPVPGGAVGWWALDGNAQDHISSHDGSTTPSVSFVPGKIGLGAKFQGQGGIEVPNEAALNFGPGVNFSIEAWVFAEFASTAFGVMTIVDKRVSPDISSALGFAFFLTEGRVGLQLSDTLDGGFYTVGGVGPDIRGAWHHIAVTVDRSSTTGGRFYVDGQIVHTFDATAESGDLSTPSALLIGQHCNSPDLAANFHGIIDELTVYRTALAPEEVQMLYAADQGKCTTPVAPWVLHQMQSRTVYEGQTVLFQPLAYGTQPLNYQWYLNSTNLLVGETNSALVFSNVFAHYAGAYSVRVSNAFGETNTSLGTLSILPAGSCFPVPDGMVAWWKGDGSPLDQYSTNHGTLAGNTEYVMGRSGAAFAFDGGGDAVVLGNPEALRLQDFTIETWIKRNSLSSISTSGQIGMLISYGTGGYGFYLDASGVPSLTHVNYSAIAPPAAINDTEFHHVAVTKSKSEVVFYIDGQAYPVGPYEPVFQFDTDARIGSRDPEQLDCFLGIIDELAVYDRALGAMELQLIYQSADIGKCASPVPPVVRMEPLDQSIFTGQTVDFTVIASGSPPLSYQWFFEQSPIPGALGAKLTLTNLLPVQAGSYWVRVSNAWGTVESRLANLQVKPLPPCVSPADALVGCWRGESNAWDERSGNNGVSWGDPGYAAGVVGAAFVLDGTEDSILLGNPSVLRLQDFTIESWVRLANRNQVSASGGPAALFAFGWGGYAFYLETDGRPSLTKIGGTPVSASTNITDTAFHHLAVTKAGSNVVFYVDGLAYPVESPYDPGFSFISDARIGAYSEGYAGLFQGMIDELCIYSRALGAEEIRAIVDANAGGKCFVPVAPVFLKQPVDVVMPVSSNVVFSVHATGSPLMSFQWYHNGSAIEGANQSYLVLPNITLAAAGTYSVLASNFLGSVVSSNAELDVIVFTKVLQDNFDPGVNSNIWTTFGGTVLTTNYGGMLSSPNSLWFGGDGPRYATSAPVDTRQGGYLAFGLAYGSRPITGTWERVEFPQKFVVVEYQVGTGTNWVELIRCSYATYSWRRYSQTLPEGARSENTRFRWRQLAHDGAAYDHWALDDVAVFLGPSKPMFAVAPKDQQVIKGSSLALTASVNGTTPLTFAWLFNGQPIPGAVQNVLQITNAQFSHSGAYTLLASNEAGTTLSAPAVVNVTYPPALFSVKGGAAASGEQIEVPVLFSANGDENAFGFSLQFPPSRLRFERMEVSTLFTNGIVLVNTNAVSEGRLGFGVSLAANSTFTAGTQHIASLLFSTALLTEEAEAEIAFSDTPVVRQLADATGHNLAVLYQAGTVQIAPGLFEADVMPRPGGDHNVTITDWVLMGRYAALLEAPADPIDFQRADCAPRVSLGDGAITLIDWVQAGRYAVQLDPLTLVGGPAARVEQPGVGLGAPGRNSESHRQLSVASVEVPPGTEAQLAVTLAAQGNENGAAFSLSFDPSTLEYRETSLGADAKGATLYINQLQAESGRLAVLLALSPGQTFPAGSRAVAVLNFAPRTAGPTIAHISFTDTPVKREVSAVSALPLDCDYVNGSVSVLATPLSITVLGKQLALSWPGWGTNLVLQSTFDLRDASGWQSLPESPLTSNGKLSVVLPVPAQPTFFRLSTGP